MASRKSQEPPSYDDRANEFYQMKLALCRTINEVWTDITVDKAAEYDFLPMTESKDTWRQILGLMEQASKGGGHFEEDSFPDSLAVGLHDDEDLSRTLSRQSRAGRLLAQLVMTLEVSRFLVINNRRPVLKSAS